MNKIDLMQAAEAAGLPFEALEIVGLDLIEEAISIDPTATDIIIETLKERYNKAGLDGIRADRLWLRDSLEHLIAML